MLIFSSLAAAVSSVSAEPPVRTIAVSVTGSATAAPDYVVIKGQVVGGGDTGEEAYAAFHKARAKVEKELGPEGFPKLSLRTSDQNQPITVRRRLKVVYELID